MMKIVLVLLFGFIAGGFTGAIYENRRLVGEPDTTIAVFISKQAIDNARFAQKSVEEYRQLLEQGDLQALEDKWDLQEQIFFEIEAEALMVCDDPDARCREQHFKILGVTEDLNKVKQAGTP